MKKIEVEFIDADKQRYPTAGDYWEDEDTIYFKITKQENSDYEALILLHELIEYVLTTKRGISEPSISQYDIDWNQTNEKGLCVGDEPGNEPGCIYAKEHRFSENLERLMALELGVDWFKYNDSIIS